jgi:type II secretory pathway predicted ATPase ExeA
MFEPFFGFKKTPFAPTPDAKQLFESQAWIQLKARLQFLTDHRGVGLLTGEAGSGKSTAARTWLAGLNPNLYKIMYLHWSSGSALDLLRQLARDLDLELARDPDTSGRNEAVRQQMRGVGKSLQAKSSGDSQRAARCGENGRASGYQIW